MSEIDDLLGRLPIAEIAGQLGVDEQTASAAVSQVLPALVGGLQQQAESSDDAAQSLASALTQHENDLATGTIDIKQVDTEDGSKIVSHLFGDKTDDVAAALSNQVPVAGVDQGLIKKMLPILAPIVMSFIVSQITKKAGAGQAAASGGGAGDLGSILGSALGGGGAGGLGNILGSVLGGQAGSGAASPGGALGSILGSILGGKK